MLEEWVKTERQRNRETIRRIGSPISGDPDRFPIHEFANPGSTQLSSKSRTFHAAEGQSRVGGHHCIDENHSRFKLGCEQVLFGPIAVASSKGSPTFNARMRSTNCRTNSS